jgi:hypothetical protein
MRKSLLALLAVGLTCGFVGSASAHIGEQVYLVFEIPDADLADIDLRDVSIADWEDVVGDAPLAATDFFADPTVGEGAQYDPADLDYRIWLGWNSNSSHLYMAMERVDNVYINEYAGGALGELWRHDAIEFMVDGDHSGGDYTGSADENWTEEEQQLNNNRSAQQFVAIADAPDGRNVGYLGAGADWVNALPYADGSWFGWRRSDDLDHRVLHHALRRSDLEQPGRQSGFESSRWWYHRFSDFGSRLRHRAFCLSRVPHVVRSGRYLALR